MRVRVGDVRLFVEVIGSKLAFVAGAWVERPTIVVLHGGPEIDHCSARSYAPLADVAQVVLYDHRGVGRSDPGDAASWSLERWADDVRALCEALELERPVVLGHSLGSTIALEYAVRHPEHPASLVLVTPYLRVEWGRSIAAFEALGGPEAGGAARRVLDEPSAEATAEFQRLCVPLITQRPVDFAAFSSTPPNADLVAWAREHVGPVFDFEGRLGDVACAALLIAGELDPLSPPENARDVARELPNARLEVVPGVGHNVPGDDPETTLGLIREFVLG